MVVQNSQINRGHFCKNGHKNDCAALACIPDSIDELQKVQLLATQCIDEVGLQSSDGSVSVDAKSFIGMYALDFTQPIWVCCDDPSFHKKIRNIGENIE